ncbi:MAG: RNA methyltransferase [Bacillota bacterium]|nr:RNA methyltransferase [Bacillota bacterium]
MRSLGDRQERQRQGLTVIEGRRLVAEALEARVALPLVLYTPELTAHPGGTALLERAAGAGGRLTCVAPEALEACAQTVTPQGVVAVVEFGERVLPAGELASLPGAHGPPSGQPVSPPGEPALVVALDGLQDPGNVGTIVRAGLAAGVWALLLGPGTAELSSPKTLRASAGAAFRVRAWRVSSWEVLSRLREQGWRVVATRARGGAPPFATDLTGRTVILLGNEARGLAPALETLADVAVSIPMPGGAESLNVAMAGTILLYESVRQRAVVRLAGL